MLYNLVINYWNIQIKSSIIRGLDNSKSKNNKCVDYIYKVITCRFIHSQIWTSVVTWILECAIIDCLPWKIHKVLSQKILLLNHIIIITTSSHRIWDGVVHEQLGILKRQQHIKTYHIFIWLITYFAAFKMSLCS